MVEVMRPIERPSLCHHYHDDRYNAQFEVVALTGGIPHSERSCRRPPVSPFWDSIRELALN
jgi:hypothetical protein